MSHQPKVLVVDDDENILSAFKGFLKSEGCTMLAARSTQEAIKQIEQHHFSLLITDIRLKYESGVNLFMEIKGTQPAVPVIVITGYPDSVREEDVKAYGADYFFLKPLDLDKLRDAVRKCLRPDKQSYHKL